MGKFHRYAFRAAPSFDEAATRQAFARAVPLRTLVIYCYDPRPVNPNAVAKLFGDEVFPGQVIRDAQGNRVASSTTFFPVIVAGGRAIDALRSITVAQHLFGLRNIVVVHHSHCGATTFTADGIIRAWKHEHGADIAAPLRPRRQHLHQGLRGLAAARHRPHPRPPRHAEARRHLRLLLRHRLRRPHGGGAGQGEDPRTRPIALPGGSAVDHDVVTAGRYLSKRCHSSRK